MLIARDETVQQLLDLAERSSRGSGSIALVGGEAGIGKTSVISAMRDALDPEFRIAWGSCDALFTPRPLGPIHDMRESFGEDVRKRLDEGAASAEIFRSIIGELQTASGSRALVFEDVHWADEATLDFLTFIGRRVAMLRTVIVISYRSDEVDHEHPLSQVLGDLPAQRTHRFDLEPLSVRGVGILCSDSEYDGDELYRITRGNPFFVSELLAHGKQMNSPIPASVRDAVNARLNRLGPAERAFLETLSLIPGSTPMQLIPAIFGDEGDTLAMAAVGRKLLVHGDDQRLRFRHELARLATLGRLSAAQQRNLHERILSAYLACMSRPPLDSLVFHAAGALDGRRVLEFAPSAAEVAASVGSHRQAAAHLSTALRFVDEATPELAATLYEKWAYEAGLALLIDGDVIKARRHAITLWRALDRNDKVGENLRWLSRLHWYRGESTEAEHFANEAVRVLEHIPPCAELAMAYSLRSQLHMLNDRMDDAISWGRHALGWAERFDNLEARIHALNNIGTARAFRDDRSGIDDLKASLELALEHGYHEHAARVYTNLAEYGVEFRDFELAEQVIAEGISFDSQNDLDAWTHYLIGRQAQLRLEQGRLRDAETIAAGVLRLQRLTLLMRLPALIVLAKCRVRLGDSDAADLLKQAFRDAVSTDEVQYIVPVRLACVEEAWLGGRIDASHMHLQELFEVGTERMHRWDRGEVAVWARRCKIDTPAEFTADLHEPHAAELARAFDRAGRAWLQRAAPYQAGLAWLQAEDSQPGNHLIEAGRILSRLDAKPALAIAERRARVLGITKRMPRKRRGPYKAARNHPAGLTQREQEVLELIVKGDTNLQIADRLSRSQRTIEHHVSAILAKLNVHNRMEVVLRVHNEPWLLRTS